MLRWVITPHIAGLYFIAEAVDDSNKKPEKTIFCCLADHEQQSFTPSHLESLTLIKELIVHNGGKVFDTLEEIEEFLNTRARKGTFSV